MTKAYAYFHLPFEYCYSSDTISITLIFDRECTTNMAARQRQVHYCLIMNILKTLR